MKKRKCALTNRQVMRRLFHPKVLRALDEILRRYEAGYRIPAKKRRRE